MTVKKYVLIFLAAIALIVAGAFLFAAKKIYAPTEGKRISRYASPQKALLVIDVQEDYTGLKGRQPVPFNNAGAQIATINRLIESASKTGMKVAYIRQVFENNFIVRLFAVRAIDGMPGTELDSRIKVINRNDFTKKISDAFSNQHLEEFLIQNQVDEVYLVGLDAAYCVYYTALGALNRGYTVSVVKDAIMTRKNMEDVLKTIKKHGILLTTSSEITRR